MTDYRDAAAEWRQHPDNLDGWNVDPEAMLALTEAMHDAAEGRTPGDPLDVARRAWRHAAHTWRTTGALHAAGTMVAIEEVVSRWDPCSPGQTCQSHDRLCSKHSWAYQSRYGRAANE